MCPGQNPGAALYVTDYYGACRPGHYNRALEEAIQTHKGQWAKDWESQNPLSGSATFASMTPVQRVCIFRSLRLFLLLATKATRQFPLANPDFSSSRS
jgi:hypothetical protein